LFRDFDRDFLLQACLLAESVRRAPLKLANKPEPTWAALIATPKRVIASATFLPGDSLDAVAKLLPNYTPGPDHTLYLTLEPRAGFERLPPVTESIKHLACHRVVIGAEDPSLRFRGEGCRTLLRMGIELHLADGEEARRCQIILEDYAKAVQRGLPVLRVPGALELDASGSYEFRAGPQSNRSRRVDAVLGGEPIGDSWFVDIDSSNKPVIARERIIAYRSNAEKSVRRLPMKNGAVDLGALLRDLCSLGILSVELNDPSLLSQALAADLVDTVLARLPEEGTALSRYAKVHFTSEEKGFDLRLSGAKLSDGDPRYLEARGELC
jgi:pyrimidine deaminase RibD-like protein